MQHDQKKSSSRKSRELALQVLFKLDCLGEKKESENTLSFLVYKNLLKELLRIDKPAWKKAHGLVQGVLDRKSELDKMVDQNMANSIRLSHIDRNILRIGLYELSQGQKVNIVINEAIEVAKTYSTLESGKLVNRVLDQASRLGV